MAFRGSNWLCLHHLGISWGAKTARWGQVWHWPELNALCELTCVGRKWDSKTVCSTNPGLVGEFAWTQLSIWGHLTGSPASKHRRSLTSYCCCRIAGMLSRRIELIQLLQPSFWGSCPLSSAWRGCRCLSVQLGSRSGGWLPHHHGLWYGRCLGKVWLGWNLWRYCRTAAGSWLKGWVVRW